MSVQFYYDNRIVSLDISPAEYDLLLHSIQTGAIDPFIEAYQTSPAGDHKATHRFAYDEAAETLSLEGDPARASIHVRPSTFAKKNIDAFLSKTAPAAPFEGYGVLALLYRGNVVVGYTTSCKEAEQICKKDHRYQWGFVNQVTINL